MKTKKDQIYDFLKLHAAAHESAGITTQYISEALDVQRSNASKILNELVEEGLVSKSNSRPVLYKIQASEDAIEEQCFRNLIGANGSLRRPIKLAKAAIIYPEKSLNTLIVGEPGTGKTFMAMIMHRFATATDIFSQDAPYIVFNCKEYQGDEDHLMQHLFGDSGTYAGMGEGVLLIDNAHLLNSSARNKLCKAIEQDSMQEEQNHHHVLPMVIITCDRLSQSACDDFSKKIPIKIELPPLTERPIEERMALIQSFFTLEAARAKKTLLINAELLRCLLLYESTLNIKQLKLDIKRGCAIAYLREHGTKDDVLNIFMSDFEPHVRKGFLHYREHRDDIERIIPADYNYSFSESTMEMSAIDRAKLNATSLYSEIDRKAEALSRRGLSREEVDVLLAAESEAIIRTYWQNVSKRVVNKEQLQKIVAQRTIDLVEIFLNEVSLALSENFPPSVFYGLCLHVDSLAKGNTAHQFISNRQIANLVENHKTKYAFSLQFAARVEQTFSIKLPVEEAFFITMFLCFEDPMADLTQRPVILFALSGSGVASAISNAVNQLVNQNSTFFFEIPFDHQPAETYAALLSVIEKIDRGKGVVVLYDMDYLCEFFETINLETGIEIRAVHYPVTMLGLEWARKAMVATDVDMLVQNAANPEEQNSPMKRVIVTLCSTGMGGAEELKKYIEQYGDVAAMQVIPLSTSDPEQLRDTLLRLQKNAVIHCIVGTEDPRLFGIPFISISEVFGVDPSALPEILRFKYRRKSRIDFDEVFNYLGDQLKSVNIKKLRRMLPELIDQINKDVMQMSLDTEIGLLMHIACAVNRMLAKDPLPQNLRKEQILSMHHACYMKLLKLVKPLERSFGIIITDDEMANIIMIINKL